MLQSIREHTQGWIAGTIITIIILSFSLWGIHSYLFTTVNDNVVASVNGVDINKDQLRISYERLRRQAQSQYGSTISAKDETFLKDRALQTLIDIEVLKQASVSQGFRVYNLQVDNYLESMPEFQVNGQFSMQRFQEVLSSALLNTSDFLELIRTSLQIDQPRLGIELTAFSLPEETNYTIALVNQERSIEYLTIPLTYFLAKPGNVSAEKIQAYYNQHKQDFMTPEQVSVEYLELSLPELTKRMTPAESALKSFYNENTNSFTQPKAWKLSNIEIPISQTATPSDIATAQTKAEAAMQAISKGENAAKTAGLVISTLNNQNWMTLNQVPAEWQQSVVELTKPNQVIGPIKTSKGFIILKAIAIQEPKMQSFDAVKDKVKETYLKQRAEEKFAELRDQLADLTYEHPESLQAAAKALDLPIKTSELFTQNKAGKGISQHKKIRDVAFNNEVMNLQNNSDVIQLNPETLIVLHLKSHIPSNLLPLKDVDKQIGVKLKTQEADIQAAKLAEDIKNRLQSGANIESILNSYQLKWNKRGYIGRYSTKVDTAILDLAFRMPNPTIAKNQPVYGITRLPNGYAVVSLKSVKEGAPADNKQAAVFAEQVQNSDGLLEYELYKQSLVSTAKISK